MCIIEENGEKALLKEVSACIIEENGEKSLIKRRGKGREREKGETEGTCTIQLLTNFVQ